MDLIKHYEDQQTATLERPQLQAGDVVRVEMKVTEGDKERLQVFEGTVLGIRGSGPSVTFTVRRDVGRFAVERIFPLYNPLITSIEIVKRQKVRRAKLGYLRQAGRRRVKEDEKAMQRHVRAQEEKKRLAEVAKKKEEERLAAEEAAKQKAEAEAKKTEEAETESKSTAADESADTPAAEADKADDKKE